MQCSQGHGRILSDSHLTHDLFIFFARGVFLWVGQSLFPSLKPNTIRQSPSHPSPSHTRPHTHTHIPHHSYIALQPAATDILSLSLFSSCLLLAPAQNKKINNTESQADCCFT